MTNRMGHGLALGWLLLLAGCAELGTAEKPADAGGDAQARAAVCSHYVCRGPTRVELRQPDNNLLVRQFDWFNPIVQDRSISVLPGETVHVEAREEQGRLVDLKAVTTVEHPERTLNLHLEQEPGSTAMMLSVENPFQGALRYQLVLMDSEKGQLYRAKSCSVIPGGTSFSTWPHPIFQLLMMEPTLLPASAGQVCDE